GHPLHLHVTALKAAALSHAGEAGPKLEDLGITDAEQLFALAGDEEVRTKLSQTLQVSKQELDSLVKEAKKAIPPDVAADLEHPLPPLFALGAMPPGQQPAAEAIGETFEEPPAIAAVGLPGTVNLISHMSPIRNQGARGTCVSFALTSINEYV